VRKMRLLTTVVVLFLASALGEAHAADLLVEWDFSKGQHDWAPVSCIRGTKLDANGLTLNCVGEDPYLVGPVVPKLEYIIKDKALEVTIRMKLTKGTACQLFYGRAFSEKDSLHFEVKPDGQFHDYSLELPPLPEASRVRLDPPPDCGPVTVASIRLVARGKLALPNFRNPRFIKARTDPALKVRSGDLELVYWTPGTNGPDRFEIRVDGVPMASTYSADLMAIGDGSGLAWIPTDKAQARVTSQRPATVERTFQDPKGGKWKLTTTFKPIADKGAIEIESVLECSAETRVFHAPVFAMLAGLGTFAPKKTQALFAGLEYLEDEPSSSEKDLRGPNANRLIPSPLKVTFPLMVVHHKDRYVGLMWEMSPTVSPIFDSPNRTYGTGGHLMGLVAPGVGLRRENRLIASSPLTVGPGKPIRARFTILGGKGTSVVPAVQQYVALNGLPEIPKSERDAAERLLAAGWLDSGIGKGGLYSHCAGWKLQPAADACCFMRRLAQTVRDDKTRGRLSQAADAAAKRLSSETMLDGVSHVRSAATAPLVLGGVIPAFKAAGARAKAGLKAFRPDGSVHCRNGMQTTHWSDEANGYAAMRLKGPLEYAALAGDNDLIARALRLVKALDKFDNTVPRGAQTWEIPLHTPDILASGQLVDIYLAAFELTGDNVFLGRAKYWAWTGLPFVYLRRPAKPVGAYATIAVYGATGRTSPCWIGLPVQWCGLVYADALSHLAEYDPKGPWLKIARGITACGLQISRPISDKGGQGLLPDVFNLQSQGRSGPAINPGTVQANLPGLFGDLPYHRFRRLTKSGAIVHVPGSIRIEKDEPTEAIVVIDAWPKEPFYAALSGVAKRPAVTIDGKAPVDGAVDYDGETKLLVVKLSKSGTIRLNW